MSADLKAKLVQVAARIAATQERLRGVERSAASLRQDLESLRSEVERDADEAAPDDEWGHRVPTRPLAVGSLGGKGGQEPAADGAADRDGAAASVEDEPWPER
jgi:hypothetical protein